MRKIVLVAVLFVAVVAGFASAAVDIRLFRIEEKRSIQFVKDISHPADAIQITLSLSGPEASAATHYGELKLEEAVDNTGANLIPAKDSFINNATKFQEFSNAFFRENHMDKSRPVADPQIEINLASAKRTATKIARLRGTISLSDKGTLKTAELTGLKPGDKKKMDLPTNAGVTITTDIKKGNNLRELKVEITGNADAIDSLELFDAAGKKVNIGYWSTGDGLVYRTINLIDKPLDETMKLVAKISVDRKITKIPFDLKDIVLP
ncbi:MAG: hypothetical protein FWD61_01780 [Phycisphaerales bacterium]|nr:hypothetical protein [Phycisphaerales bacterium]